MRKRKLEITHFFKGIGIALGNLTEVACRRGSFGKITLFQHPELGKVFVLNGEIQHVEAWAPLYHEPLVHLSASFIPVVRDVLILGGGTLYAASEALKYKSVERVVVFDHDPCVPKLAAEYYRHAQACFGDTRFHLAHKDAYSSISALKGGFDLIINDGVDLLLLGAKSGNTGLNLFTTMTRALRPCGVCADVVYRHIFERHRTIRTIWQLRKSKRLAVSLVFLPEYHGVLHALCMWGSRSSEVNQCATSPRNEEQRHWIKNPLKSPYVYYAPNFLDFYLYLPTYVKNALNPKKRAF